MERVNSPEILNGGVDSLVSMFPELDRETISQILEENGGVMERCVEVLLQFCGGNESRGHPASQAVQPPPPPRQQQQQQQAEETFPAPSHDFLTLGRYTRGVGGARGGAGAAASGTYLQSASQLEADEALAIALSRQLQDSMFLTQLESNPAMRDEIRGAWHGGGGEGGTGGQAGMSPARAAGRGTYSGEGGGMSTFEGIFGVSAEVHLLRPLILTLDTPNACCFAHRSMPQDTHDWQVYHSLPLFLSKTDSLDFTVCGESALTLNPSPLTLHPYRLNPKP